MSFLRPLARQVGLKCTTPPGSLTVLPQRAPSAAQTVKPDSTSLVQAGRLQLLQHRGYATVPAEVQKFDWDIFEDIVTTDDGRRDLERLKGTFRELENQAKQTKQVIQGAAAQPLAKSHTAKPVSCKVTCCCRPRRSTSTSSRGLMQMC